MNEEKTVKLKKKDFATDQDVRWCPGCGDYAILSTTQQAFAALGLPRHQHVIVSGIGCASRFPYYMSTYGFHTIHGRAPAVATGIKIANPELSVWIVSGDGDAFSIGGNHIIHLMRRNPDLNVLLFDNQIYGLTKGQYSPTSEFGKRTKSSPYGSVDRPFNPLSVVLGAGATFIARSIDVYAPHLKQVLLDAQAHRGTSFVQIYQNCNIFNDGAFAAMRDKGTRDDVLLDLKHGEPLIFGKDRDRGIRLNGAFQPEVVKLGNGITEADLIVHDEQGPVGYLAMLASLEAPEFPVPVGVLRRTQAATLETAIRDQVRRVTEDKGPGDLKSILYSGNTWTVGD
ncbi:MAG: 2-oxoacid:ferredoxin oxidoreductase subunit beta [Acidobacteriota bacterium]|nr:2-oxoacid:ferredoxin oxidoreductase subunit beta [Acidobacteriota bacterium]MDH3784759.1 2-oxoacid:ferredoxin oxidoreductase subunit beta [Acidobacteriota bacterium]